MASARVTSPLPLEVEGGGWRSLCSEGLSLNRPSASAGPGVTAKVEEPKYKKDKQLNEKISLFRGDITKLEVDAIVNAGEWGRLAGLSQGPGWPPCHLCSIQSAEPGMGGRHLAPARLGQLEVEGVLAPQEPSVLAAQTPFRRNPDLLCRGRLGRAALLLGAPLAARKEESVAGSAPGCPARKAEARTGRFDLRGCRRPTTTPPPLPPACHAPPPADLAQTRGFVKGKVGAEALVPKAQLPVGAPADSAVYCDEWTNLFSPLLGAEGRWVLSSQTVVVWPRSRVGVKGQSSPPGTQEVRGTRAHGG